MNVRQEAKSLGLGDAFKCAWCGEASARYNHGLGFCRCQSCCDNKPPGAPWNAGLSDLGGRKLGPK
ncbi:hypothetical protein UFOVP1313_67 [uncultured Caudovirales phage]|uniref:Uncharacterized protein n=1 Tax=uncultured Caudovirales phage TaxID=2100421 RepID=A0A6J5S0H0_9CAUD|nr:hypothetical protein UFOVP1313_67 [uncultured Caudovirales phage]